MKRFLLVPLLAATALSACSQPEQQPEVTLSEWETYIQNSENHLRKGGALGLAYFKPKSRRSCKMVYLYLSQMEDTGLETRWTPMETAKIGGQVGGAPTHRRVIEGYPILFKMRDVQPVRIDGVTCETYTGELKEQLGEFARVEPEAGQVSFFGQFTQTPLNNEVDVFPLSKDLAIAQSHMERDSAVIEEVLVTRQSRPWQFKNYDNVFVSMADLQANENNAGDYYYISRALREDALTQLDGLSSPLTDLDLTGNALVLPKEVTKKLENKLSTYFKAADTHERFEAILNAGKDYDVAVDHFLLADALTVAERRNKKYNNINTVYKERVRLREDLEQAEAKLAAHIKQHRLQSIFDAALPESRIAAREAWYEEMESLSRILTTSFSGLTETLKRERLEQAAEGYISAKYESLREEYDGLLRLAQPPQNTTRQTIRGLKRIEGIERVFMSELIEGFAKSDMSQNETYHTALESFYGNWTQVIDLRNRMFLVAAPE